MHIKYRNNRNCRYTCLYYLCSWYRQNEYEHKSSKFLNKK